MQIFYSNTFSFTVDLIHQTNKSTLRFIKLVEFLTECFTKSNFDWVGKTYTPLPLTTYKMVQCLFLFRKPHRRPLTPPAYECRVAPRHSCPTGLALARCRPRGSPAPWLSHAFWHVGPCRSPAKAVGLAHSAHRPCWPCRCPAGAANHARMATVPPLTMATAPCFIVVASFHYAL